MGYDTPPWEFKGRALYQLSLVKVEEARRFLPPELPLVNFFGWTLGGFYLARYSHSPVGAFDELVVLAGLAWNFPSSCAWAARVYVNNRAARDHGLSSVGLPSRLAAFRAVPLAELGGGQRSSTSAASSGAASWWDSPRKGGAARAPVTTSMELSNCERHGGGWLPAALGGRRRGRGLHSPVCDVEMPSAQRSWAPRIQMFLPSFSGATPDVPGLLKYSLRLMTRVRLVRPLKVRLPAARPEADRGSAEVLDAVLGGRPLLCMAFDDMEMEVQAPQAWATRGHIGAA